jgi:hypothetical protein
LFVKLVHFCPHFCEHIVYQRRFLTYTLAPFEKTSYSSRCTSSEHALTLVRPPRARMPVNEAPGAAASRRSNRVERLRRGRDGDLAAQYGNRTDRGAARTRRSEQVAPIHRGTNAQSTTHVDLLKNL